MMMATGGAYSTHQYSAALRRNDGFRPHHSTIAVEGIFRPHYFPLKKLHTEYLCEPVCSFARVLDPMTHEKEEYLSIGLIGSEDGKKHRDDLNLVVVLDVSGSMDSAFNAWYNRNVEGCSKKATAASKLTVAKECLKKLFKNLKGNERFGVVLFSDTASILQPLRAVSSIDEAQLIPRIDALATVGGTDLYCGMKVASEMLQEMLVDDAEAKSKNPNIDLPRNNRIIYLTDCNPNQGGDFDQMYDCASTCASKKYSIFTSFIGVGVDFNSETVAKLTKIRGANYFSVDGEESFEKLLLTDFNYMVTPICFNVEVFVESESYEIERSYGSVFDANEFSNIDDSKQLKLTRGFLTNIVDKFTHPKNPQIVKPSGNVMRIDTLSASDIDDNKGVQGGVCLLQMKKKLSSKTPTTDAITVTIKYENANGKAFLHSTVVNPKNCTPNSSNKNEKETPISELEAADDEELFHEDNAVRKAILLVRYVRLAKKMLIDYANTKEIPAEKKKEVKEFQKWFKAEMGVLNDNSLNEHYDNLDRLKLT